MGNYLHIRNEKTWWWRENFFVITTCQCHIKFNHEKMISSEVKVSVIVYQLCNFLFKARKQWHKCTCLASLSMLVAVFTTAWQRSCWLNQQPLTCFWRALWRNNNITADATDIVQVGRVGRCLVRVYELFQWIGIALSFLNALCDRHR